MPDSALVPKPTSKVESLPPWPVARGSPLFVLVISLIASVVSITCQS